jgi:EmrB/QacA subfamily drug resistance transporter
MEANDLKKSRVMLIMSGVMLGVLMSALDSTIVGTAMPKIINDLHGMEHYAWPFTAYMLLSTLAIPVFGKLADIFGRKIVYLIGIFTFLAASMLCGLSQNMIQLIVFRGLQGIGGGILISNAFAIVGEIFPPRERGKYVGIVASMFGVANLLGPSVGGFITDALNWRWVFYVNLPIALIAVGIVALALPGAIEHHEKRSIDFPGIAALVGAFGPMLLAFSWAGRDYAWLSPQILGLLAFSLAMLTLFLYIESKVKEPILPLFLFRNPTFNVSIAASFLANAAMFGGVIFIPLYVQGVTGLKPSASGLIVTPMMLTFTIFSIAAGQIVSRTGRYKAIALSGFGLATIAMALLSTLTASTPHWQLILYMIALGGGLGVNTPIFQVTIQSAFPAKMIGISTSAGQFFRNIGGTVGSAVFGSILLSTMASRIAKIDWGGTPAAFAGRLKDPKLLSNPAALAAVRDHIPAVAMPYFDHLLIQVRNILGHSLHMVFLAGIVVAAIAFLVTLLLKEKSLDHVEEDQPIEACDNC